MEKNCIFSISSGDQAEVRHCSYHGFERFNVLVLGDRFLLKSVDHGDCVSGGNFVDCDCAPTFYVTGTPRNYNIRLYIPGDNNGNICLVRKSCHSSTSDLKFDKCDHCGAKHWSIEGDAVGEDDMKNCINRRSKNTGTAYVSHCSAGYEKLSYEIIPPQCVNIESDKIHPKYFPNPNVNEYRSLDLTQGCRGLKLFRNSQGGTVEVEVVHFLPIPFQNPDDSDYSIHYMVTHIHTNIPYLSSYTNWAIL